MRLFIELMKRSLQRQFTYRAAVLAGLATNLFFGLLRIAVMKALYGARPEVAGVSLQQAVTFTGVSQAVIDYLSLFNWSQVIQSVYSGQVAADLLKPMDYYFFWLAQDIGRALVELLLRSLPIMLVYALLFHITYPTGLAQWAALVCAIIFGLLVSFSWRFLVNLAAFWVPNALGISRFAFLLAYFCSGFFFPLRYFPAWFQTLCNLTPFPATVNTIIEISLGLVSGPALLQALGMQVFWVLALFLVNQLVLRAGVRRLVILGG